MMPFHIGISAIGHQICIGQSSLWSTENPMVVLASLWLRIYAMTSRSTTCARSVFDASFVSINKATSHLVSGCRTHYMVFDCRVGCTKPRQIIPLMITAMQASDGSRVCLARDVSRLSSRETLAIARLHLLSSGSSW